MENFTTKVASLKANIEAAKDALEIAQRNFDDAQKAYSRYRNRVAKALQKDWEAVLANIPDVIVIGSQRENVQISCTATDCSISIQAWSSAPVFCFWAHGAFAWYDTPEQVKTVIEMFKAAVACGDSVFRFPSAAELSRVA